MVLFHQGVLSSTEVYISIPIYLSTGKETWSCVRHVVRVCLTAAVWNRNVAFLAEAEAVLLSDPRPCCAHSPRSRFLEEQTIAREQERIKEVSSLT